MAGHTKFAFDPLFSLIANAYNRADIFTATELQQVKSCSSVQLLSKTPQTSKDGEVHSRPSIPIFQVSKKCMIFYVHTCCHVGNLMASPLSVMYSSQSCIPLDCYGDQPQPLFVKNIAHLVQIYICTTWSLASLSSICTCPTYQSWDSTNCSCIRSWPSVVLNYMQL